MFREAIARRNGVVSARRQDAPAWAATLRSMMAAALRVAAALAVHRALGDEAAALVAEETARAAVMLRVRGGMERRRTAAAAIRQTSIGRI